MIGEIIKLDEGNKTSQEITTGDYLLNGELNIGADILGMECIGRG